MAQFSLGKIVVNPAGTPIRLTANQSAPGANYPAHSYLVEALSGNTGKIYIGTSTLDKTTLAGVYAILPPPTANIFPSFSATVSYSPNHFNLAEIYVDVDNAGEGVVASAIVS